MAETDDEKAAEFIPGATTYESAFQDYPGDANRWGWTEDEEEPDWPSLVPEVWPVFNVLGINTEPNIPGERDGPNHDVYFEHYTQTKHDGVVYPEIGGNYRNMVNTKDGCIVAWMNFSPKHYAGRRNPPVTVLPKLQNWSDIAFLSWKKHGGGKNLRYVFRAAIANSQFPQIIGRALREAGLRKDDTPFDEFEECSRYVWARRREFSMDTDIGKALLGSPNGRGIGYLLVQHKSTFGTTATVNKVTFYCTRDVGEMNMIFHIVPGSEDNDNNGPDEEPHKKPPQ